MAETAPKYRRLNAVQQGWIESATLEDADPLRIADHRRPDLVRAIHKHKPVRPDHWLVPIRVVASIAIDIVVETELVEPGERIGDKHRSPGEVVEIVQVLDQVATVQRIPVRIVVTDIRK